MARVDELPRTPIHQSLMRPVLVAGGEREPMQFLALVSIIVGIAGGLHIVNLITGTLVFSIGSLVLRKMAQADHKMYRVFMRYVKHQKFYRAVPTMYANPRYYAYFEPWSE